MNCTHVFFGEEPGVDISAIAEEYGECFPAGERPKENALYEVQWQGDELVVHLINEYAPCQLIGEESQWSGNAV